MHWSAIVRFCLGYGSTPRSYRLPHKRKAWLFCWSEVGVEYVGVIQSLMTMCRLHSINPNTYLVDVLQRISTHPDKDIEALTPRRRKTLDADNPLRSDLYLATQ